jgi:protein TonB
MTMEKQNPPSRSWLKIVLVAVVGIALLGLIAWGVKTLMSSKSGKPRKPPVVTLLPDKPPPPPPPPKEEKKPEPPKEDRKDVKMEPPKETPQPAQNEPLKMEGAAGDGESAFGSGTVGREYSGGTIGATGAVQGMYAGRLQRHLQEQLSRNRKLRESDYRVTVKIWLRRDGSLERAELVASTGNEMLDQLLRESLQQIPPMREVPPENQMQPMKIRVTNRGAT